MLSLRQQWTLVADFNVVSRASLCGIVHELGTVSRTITVFLTNLAASDVKKDLQQMTFLQRCDATYRNKNIAYT